jgi:hypothetical protein
MEPKLVRAILEMDKKDLNNALNSLNEHDYDLIQALTLELDQGVKDKYARTRKGRSMFGYWSALELLAKLGIFMNNNGRVK